MALINQFLEAQQRFQLELLAKRGVVGVGIGYKNMADGQTDELSVVAMVEKKKPRAALTDDDLVPKEVNGVKTDVIEIGIMQAQVNNSPRDIWRPTIPAGVSIGHPLVTAGTYGTLVFSADGTAYILSNNHVIAASNDAFIGDPILQPGAQDGGRNPDHAVARLSRYAKISYVDDKIVGEPNPIIGGGSNQPDDRDTPDNPTTKPDDSTSPQMGGCAGFIISLADTLAKANDPNVSVQVVNTASVDRNYDPASVTTVFAQAAMPENQLDAALALPNDIRMFDPAILQIGKLTGSMPVTLGQGVRKYGRTTGYTEGVVTVINATVDVKYDTQVGKRSARFVNQVMTSGMSSGGDSGSIIVDRNSLNGVGLLFAGSETATVFTPIDRVLQKFGVKLVMS